MPGDPREEVSHARRSGLGHRRRLDMRSKCKNHRERARRHVLLGIVFDEATSSFTVMLPPRIPRGCHPWVGVRRNQRGQGLHAER